MINHNDDNLTECEGCRAPEEWREHPQLPNLWISNLGKVRTTPRSFTQRNRWGGVNISNLAARDLKLTTARRNGYHCISFNGRQYKVHALMLETFVGPRPQGWQSCHYDDNPTHNCLKNLRWDTAQGNNDDRVRHGTTVRFYGDQNPLTTITPEVVDQIKVTPGKLKELAERFGISMAQVSRIRRGLSRRLG